MDKITINTKKPYDVLFVEDVFNYLKNEMKDHKYLIISDTNVVKLYEKQINGLINQTNGYLYVVNHGEENKNYENYLDIIGYLSQNNFHRNDYIVAFGGGMIGDLSGFVSSTYLRSIPYIQIPTTLLSMVDSSVGGKTAINTPYGKNLIGSIYQPQAVIIDYHFLDTLNKKEISNGMAEIIKYGVIKDQNIIDYLNKENIDYSYLVPLCVAIKNEFVSNDENDQGKRQILNFGHTYGHALEKISDYQISHGQAVASGMIFESKISKNKDIVNIIDKLVQKFDLAINDKYDISSLIDIMLLDKKNISDKISFVVVKNIGQCEIEQLTIEDIKKIK
ncbi:MAG: 3-dehydroquinate synthase [Erysipelotrichaceae bacterium]